VKRDRLLFIGPVFGRRGKKKREKEGAKYQPFQPEAPRRGAIQIPKQIGGDKEKMKRKTIGVLLIAGLVVLSVISLLAIPAAVAEGDRPEPEENTVYSWAPGYGTSMAKSQYYEHLGDHPNNDVKDQTGVVTTLNDDGTLDITVKVWTKGGAWEYLNVWIDWDGDKTFEDDEKVVATPHQYYNSGYTTQTFPSISIPSDAVAKTYLRAQLSSWPDNPGPVATWDYGDVEDYEITLLTPEIPEFATIAIPAVAVLGLFLFYSHRKRKEE